jgi:hypothetical protein
MKISIWSHFRGQTWTGEIPQSTNGEIFRLFNRVDVEDAERLSVWNYTLPSLSVGDTISYDGRTFAVEGVGFIEVTRYEHEQMQARALAGEISLFGLALHRIEVTTSDSTVGGFVTVKTNDDDDDGYPDGEWVEWEQTFGTADKALEYAGKCHVGISGVIVTVTHNGEEVR